MAFTKGKTYIVKTKGSYWYVVHQVSMKGWIAVRFTEVEVNYTSVFLKGNGQKLYADLNVDDMREFRTNNQTSFRKTMYNILKVGSFEDG